MLSTLSTAKQPDHITQPDSGLRFCSACCSFQPTDECPVCPRSQAFNLLSTGEDLVPPSISAAALVAGADGVALAAGELIEGNESSVWTGRFRPL